MTMSNKDDLAYIYKMYNRLQLNMLSAIKEGFKKNDAQIIENQAKALNYCEIRGPLDQIFRDFLMEFIDNEAVPEQLQDLVTLSIETARKGGGILSYSIPVVLLSDIFEFITLDGCEIMFAYVEDKVDVWKEEIFFGACKNNLLRLCNDLIRRSPRSTSNVFCGRIQLFLAKFFPFSERSGLNIVSEFNLENTTEYGTDGDDASKTKDNMDKDVDYSLYCKFWSLQDFFRNPTQIYDKVQWKTFCSHTNCILSTFKGIKLEHVEDKLDTSIINSQFFSKYLTSPKLFNLQLYDVSFRRHVLVQFLIILQYLTTTVRFKTDTLELNNNQTEWVRSTVDKVYSLIRETPPGGENFARCIRNILKREEYWIKWKNEGCPDFKKLLPSTSTNEPVEKKKEPKRHLGDILKEAHKNEKFDLGDPELTKLWNINTDNLEACRNKERDFLPTLDVYFEEALQQSGEGQSELLKDGNFGWRGLRLLARRSPNFFTSSNNQITELHKYLEQMIKSIRAEHDKPGSSTQERNETEEEDLFKQPEDSSGDIKDTDNDEVDDNILRFKAFFLPESHFEAICQKLVPSWKIVAQKLGYKEDEIEFLTTKGKEEIDAVKGLLHLWFDEDDFSTLENFLYTLEGLKLEEAAAEVKIAIEEFSKTQTFFNAA